MEENQQLENSNKNELKINELMKEYLITTSKWTKFLAVMFFIAVGFMAICGIAMFFVGSLASLPSGSGGVLGTFYLIVAALYVPMAVYLNNFSDNMKNAINYTNNDLLQTAFQNLKSYFKYQGILIITCIILYILFIIGVVIAAIVGFSAF